MSTPIRAYLSRDLSILRGNSPHDESSPLQQMLQDHPDVIDFEMTKISKSKRVRRRFQINLVKRIMKWKANSQFHFQHVKRVRYTTEDTLSYQLQFGLKSPYWITIVYYNYNKSPNLKIMHLIADSKQQFDSFVSIILKLTSLSNGGVNNFKTLVEASDFKSINLSDLIFLLQSWNLNLSNDNLQLLSQMDTLDKKSLRNFVDNLTKKDELINILTELDITSKTTLSSTEFTRFVKEIQHETYPQTQIDDIFNKYSTNGEMSLNDLNSYIYSKKPLLHHIDLDQPLNEYFISSSHNTYLLGKQIYGKSSIEGYIQALQRGCRSLEIDIWDSELEPLVTHGRTFTDSITLEAVLECINRYAFWFTSLPLILSLEIKCNDKNQLKCIECLKTVFGDQLILQEEFKNDQLPTPNQLRNKILLKVKKSSMPSSNTRTASLNPNNSLSMTTSNSLLSELSDDSSSSSSSSNSSPTSSISSSIKKIKNQVSVLHSFTRMAPYLVGLKYRNFSLPESKTFNHIFSFGDKQLANMTENEEKLKAILKHNKMYMMRVYPSVTRFNSKNFLPVLFWDVGVQMVATNWQIWDQGQELNESLFKYSMGYYLKPRIMRDLDRNKEVLFGRFQRHLKRSLSVEIICGNELIKPVNQTSISPFIEIEFYNLSCIFYKAEDFKIKKGDDPSITFISNTIENDGFKPKWEAKLQLDYFTNVNELGFIRFIIKSQKTIIGTWSGRLHDLKRGFRYLRLNDINGEEFTNSSLLIRVK